MPTQTSSTGIDRSSPFLEKPGFMKTKNNGTSHPNFCLNNTNVETKVEQGLWMHGKKGNFHKVIEISEI